MCCCLLPPPPQPLPAAPLQKLTGSADGLLAAQRSPSTPLQRLAAHKQEVAELVGTHMGGTHMCLIPVTGLSKALQQCTCDLQLQLKRQC